MPQVRPVEKIQRAARYFANTSQDVHDIAAKFKVTEFAVPKMGENARMERGSCRARLYRGWSIYEKTDTRRQARRWQVI